MTTKLVVLAALLTVANAAPRREVRVQKAARAEARATPSIEPQWPARPQQLVARR